VTALYTTQQQCYAFSPIPKDQKISAAIVASGRGDKKITIEKDARGRLGVHQYITSSNNDNRIDDINNSIDQQSLKGAAASIILGTVTATQLGVGLASAAYIDSNVHQVAISSAISDSSVVVNKQQLSVPPFNNIEDSTLDSSINHFLLAADTDTATLEKKEESTTSTTKAADDETKKLEEVAAKQKAEAAVKKKADEAKKAAAEEAIKKKVVEQKKIADQRAKDEAAAKIQSEKAEEESTKPNESSTKSTEEQTLLEEGDELIKDKIERIAATKQAEEAEEQLIKEKQDKIDKLYAEQKARSSTITKLKSAQEQAIQQKLTNQQTETNKRLELDKLLSNAEQYRINTAEQTRLIELDIKLNQLELVAYEERIEVIQEQVNKLEKLNDDTRIILEKLGVKGEDLPKVVEPKKVASTRTTPSSSLSVKPKTTSPSISGLSSSGGSSDESSTSSDLSPTALGVISVFITAGTVAGAYFFNDDNTDEDSGMINDPMGGGFGNTSGGGPSFPPSQGGPGLNENGFGSNADSSYPPSQSNNAQGNTFGGGASGFSPPAMKGQEQSNSNSGFGSMGGMNKAQSGGTPSFGTRAQPPSTGFGTSSSSSPPQSGGSAGFGQQQGGMNKTSFGNSSAFGNKGSIGKTSSPLQSGGTPSFGQQQSSGFGNITPANTMKGPQSTSNTGFGSSSPQAGSSKGFGQQKSAGFVSPGSMKGSTSSAPAFGSSGGFVSKRDSMKGGETKQQSGGNPSFNSSPSISLKGSQGTSFGGVNMMKGKEAGGPGKQSSFGSSSSFGSATDKSKQPGGFGSMKGPPVTVEKGKGAGSGFTTLDKKSPTSSQGIGFGGMMKGTSSAGKDSSTSAPSYGSKGGFVSKRDSMKSSTDSTTEKKGGFGSSIGSTAKVQSGGTPSFSSGLGNTGASSTETKQSGGTPSFGNGGLGNTGTMKGAQSSSSPPGFGSAGGFVSKRDSTDGSDKKLQSGGTPSFGSGSFGSPKGGIDTKKSSVGSTAFPTGGTSFGGVNMMKGKEAGSTIDKKSASFTMKNTPKSTQPGGLGNVKGAGSGFTSLDKKSTSSSRSGFDSKKASDGFGFSAGGMMKGSATSPFTSGKSSTGPVGMIKDSSSPFKMGSSTDKGSFESPQKGKEGVDTKMSKKSSVGASAFPSGGTSFGGVNMMKGKETGSSPGKKSFGSTPAFGKKMSDKGITSPMDKKSTSSFTMKGSTDSSKSGGMKMDSSSPFKMGDKASFGSPKGKGGVGLDTNKMGKKSSVGVTAFPSGGTLFGGVNMMKGKEAG